MRDKEKNSEKDKMRERDKIREKEKDKIKVCDTENKSLDFLSKIICNPLGKLLEELTPESSGSESLIVGPSWSGAPGHFLSHPFIFSMFSM